MDQEMQMEIIYQSWQPRITEHYKALDQVARLMYEEFAKRKIPKQHARFFVQEKINRLCSDIVDSADKQEKRGIT